MGFQFTDAEREAMVKVERMTKALQDIDAKVQLLNNRIQRETAKRDRLLAQKQAIQTRLRQAIDLIDTAKQR